MCASSVRHFRGIWVIHKLHLGDHISLFSPFLWTFTALMYNQVCYCNSKLIFLYKHKYRSHDATSMCTLWLLSIPLFVEFSKVLKFLWLSVRPVCALKKPLVFMHSPGSVNELYTVPANHQQGALILHWCFRSTEGRGVFDWLLSSNINNLSPGSRNIAYMQ